MNFLLKQQMQDEHQDSYSQQKLGKAEHFPPGGEGVRSSFLCCSPGSTSEVTANTVFLHLLFWRSEVEYTCISQLALSNQCHPFPRWLGTAEGTIVHAADESSERLPDTRARCWHPTDVFPILLHWTSLHQPWDLSGFTAALRAWRRAKVWHSCGDRVHRCQQQPQCPLQWALLEG